MVRFYADDYQLRAVPASRIIIPPADDQNPSLGDVATTPSISASAGMLLKCDTKAIANQAQHEEQSIYRMKIAVDHPVSSNVDGGNDIRRLVSSSSSSSDPGSASPSVSSSSAPIPVSSQFAVPLSSLVAAPVPKQFQPRLNVLYHDLETDQLHEVYISSRCNGEVYCTLSAAFCFTG